MSESRAFEDADRELREWMRKRAFPKAYIQSIADAAREIYSRHALELERENQYLRKLVSRQRDEIQNLDDMADAVECLRGIGKLVGCGHVDDPDGRRQLVNCVERALNGESA
jgi:hypothetical protein